MESVRMTCSACGGPLEMSPDAKSSQCTYCGARTDFPSQHGHEIQKLKLQQDLLQCDQNWQEKRASYLTRGEEPNPDAVKAAVLITLALALFLSLVAVSALVSSYSRKLPTEADIAQYESRQLELRQNPIPIGDSRGPKTLVDGLLENPELTRKHVLQDRSTAWNFFGLHVLFYTLVGGAYLHWRVVNSQSEELTHARRDYHWRREMLVTEIARLSDPKPEGSGRQAGEKSD